MTGAWRLVVWGGLLVLSACSGPARADDAPTHRRDPAALGPYSGSVAEGDRIWVSGKIAATRGAIAAEAHGALDAVAAELAHWGRGLEDLLQVTVYLTDIGDYAAFNEVYAARVPRPHPARAVVEVAALPGDARVEIVAVARRR